MDPRIWGGIQEADLQILIRDTMQDHLAQRDDTLQVLSSRLNSVDERTRQGLESFDERLERLAKELKQKVDISTMEQHLSTVETATQRKFEGFEWRCKTIDDGNAGTTQRIGQICEDLERKDDKTREIVDRIDDLHRRFPQKADSAYVDVRIGELRCLTDRSDLDQSMRELTEKMREKDEQIHMMLQQLSGKDEQIHIMLHQLSGKVDLESVKEMLSESSQDLERLSTQVQRVDEQGSLKSRALGEMQSALEDRFNDFSMKVLSTGSGQIRTSSLGAGLSTLDETARLDVGTARMTDTMPLFGSQQVVVASQGPARRQAPSPLEPQQFNIMSPRPTTNGAHVSLSGRVSPVGSFNPPGASLVSQAVAQGLVVDRQSVSQTTSVAASPVRPSAGGGSATIPQADDKSLLTSRVQSISRSQSAPGLHARASPTQTVSVSSTPSQMAQVPWGSSSSYAAAPPMTAAVSAGWSSSHAAPPMTPALSAGRSSIPPFLQMGTPTLPMPWTSMQANQVPTDRSQSRSRLAAPGNLQGLRPAPWAAGRP